PIGYLKFDHLIPYRQGLAIQEFLVQRRHRINQERQQGIQHEEPEDVICFLQHPPTYTAGRRIRGRTENAEEKRLRSLGADYFETMRGGQVTFHGPGQLVAYPILDIREYQINVRCYVSRLEKTIIHACEQYGIKANTTENTGVWVGEDHKIAALGVHLQRYVSSHGLALNCDVDLSWFRNIVACGLPEKDVTSISEQLGRDVPVNEVIPVMARSFAHLFGKPVVEI
ncbi:lipoate-protein ligase b, partial [Radiomyces spectabilis]|uniref:lipoate-protein ligase b n=1 Tax=Radiomyces spectabilis TaxID=64574 RepID=UPI00221EE80D